MDRRVTPPERVTSPTWGPPTPCPKSLIPLKLQPISLHDDYTLKTPLTSLQLIAPHLSAANLRDYLLPDVHVRVETGSSCTHRTAAVDHSEDELVPLPSKQKE